VNTEEAAINMGEPDNDQQEVIKMKADALAKYNREYRANKEKTLSAKFQLIKPCSVVLERLKIPANTMVLLNFL
jgi:hypothetical protein